MARVFGFAPVLLFLVAGCQSLGNNYETGTLTDTQGDTSPAFVDITSTRVTLVADRLVEFEVAVADTIPLAPDPTYRNVVYKMWIDTNAATTHPEHGGGNAEYVVSLWYNSVSSAWGGNIFDCSTGRDVPASSFEVMINDRTISGRVDLSLIGNPSSFRYSYESFTDTQGHDGDPNASMDEISLFDE